MERIYSSGFHLSCFCVDLSVLKGRRVVLRKSEDSLHLKLLVATDLKKRRAGIENYIYHKTIFFSCGDDSRIISKKMSV